ncbi:MAG: hypothetical protein NTZ25_02480 [Candidatus Peregrinibacteria bacterium]|nr:hypothetical protein [Candidatus Peregrinibacteria bacterium]
MSNLQGSSFEFPTFIFLIGTRIFTIMFCKIVLLSLSISAILGCADLGPQGVMGPQGTQGPNGYNGVNGENGRKGEKGDTGPQGPAAPTTCKLQAPAATFEMIYVWNEADAYRQTCHMETDNALQLCSKGSGNTPPECTTQYKLNNDGCEYWFGLKVNKIPVRECGVEIVSITGTPGTDSFNWHIIDGDYDKDGISNFFEYLMGLNPCTPNSFGCEKDADLDYDDDGIPNGKDDSPLCNPKDPAKYQSDCV